MILSLILIIVGFVALIYGANWLVNGASSLAKKFGVSDLVIGLTIVAFGTSAPELVVNSVASADGFSDIVLGNIIGSNNFNLFIILGIAALVYPIAVQKSTIKGEIPISLLVAIVFLLLANNFYVGANSEISRWDALVMLLLFGGFLYYIFKQMKNEIPEHIDYIPKSNNAIFGLIILGFAGLILGGKLVVDNAILVATELGVSQKIIGLTIIAVGTSLPELVTSVIAAMKKNSDIAIGNVIGSNVFNVLLVIPVSTMINPIAFDSVFNQDIYILIGGTIFVLGALILSKSNKISRWHGIILLGFYLIYTGYLVSKEL
ncbi:calcium/sodium antiporter [Flavobacterium tegetincola]|uniref:calcium/sodium antiporter n=1 Tax=Flavobacterium tegetincola TaxID=150172 RepID=UPI000413CECE|nr:calcium/sodium antiporter [Flavobacterium tegetincola]